jgi:hypothetical protein
VLLGVNAAVDEPGWQLSPDLPINLDRDQMQGSRLNVNNWLYGIGGAAPVSVRCFADYRFLPMAFVA